MTGYRPSERVAKILEWALEEIKSVPYEVTSRWTFYQIVQKYGVPKDWYHKKFLPWISKARKRFYAGWTPFTLADDTREITHRGGGYETEVEWVNSFLEADCTMSVLGRQKNVVVVLYEAAAMRGQFDYVLRPLRVSSSPFQGDASIRHKAEIAKRITTLHRVFPKKPIIILYFGDLDPKGLQIPRSAMKDIWQWIDAPDLGTMLKDRSDHADGTEEWVNEKGTFRWIRVGLYAGQAKEFGISDNPEKPGTYQWEALSDPQARGLIGSAVGKFWDRSVIAKVQRLETKAEKNFHETLRRFLAKKGGQS